MIVVEVGRFSISDVYCMTQNVVILSALFSPGLYYRSDVG